MQILKVMSSQESSIYKPGIVLLWFYFGRVVRLRLLSVVLLHVMLLYVMLLYVMLLIVEVVV